MALPATNISRRRPKRSRMIAGLFQKGSLAFAMIMLVLGLLPRSGPETALVVSVFVSFALIASFLVTVIAFIVPLAAISKLGRGAVSLEDEGLEIRRAAKDDAIAEMVARDQIAIAWRASRRSVEVIDRAGGSVELEFEDEQNAIALTRLVRAAKSHKRAYTVDTETPTARALRKVPGFVVPTMFGSVFLLGLPYGLLPFAALLGVGVFVGFGSRRVEFGADGFVVRGRFTKRYVPYRDVIVVTRRRTWTGGERVLVSLDGALLSLGTMESRRAILVEMLLAEGCRMFRAGESAGAEIGALTRGGEDDEEWLERVQKMVGRGDYRDAAISPERLDELMRNPAAEPSQRVAAALALRANASSVKTIREAAEASTEPEVKRALEEIALEDTPSRAKKRAKTLRRIRGKR